MAIHRNRRTKSEGNQRSHGVCACSARELKVFPVRHNAYIPFLPVTSEQPWLAISPGADNAMATSFADLGTSGREICSSSCSCSVSYKRRLSEIIPQKVFSRGVRPLVNFVLRRRLYRRYAFFRKGRKRLSQYTTSNTGTYMYTKWLCCP